MEKVTPEGRNRQSATLPQVIDHISRNLVRHVARLLVTTGETDRGDREGHIISDPNRKVTVTFRSRIPDTEVHGRVGRNGRLFPQLEATLLPQEFKGPKTSRATAGVFRCNADSDASLTFDLPAT